MSDLVEYVDRNGDRWAFMAGDHTWLESPAHGGRRCAVWYVLREYGPLVPAGFLADMEGATQDLGEAAEEIERLRAEVASLRQQLDEALAKIEDRRMRLVRCEGDLLNIRGILSPNGGISVMPPGMEIGDEVAPVIDWLVRQLDEARGEVARLAELEHIRRTVNVPADNLRTSLLSAAVAAVRAVDPDYDDGFDDLAGAVRRLAADRDRLLDVYRAAEQYRRLYSTDLANEKPWILGVRQRALLEAVDAYRAGTQAESGVTEQDVAWRREGRTVHVTPPGPPPPPDIKFDLPGAPAEAPDGERA